MKRTRCSRSYLFLKSTKIFNLPTDFVQLDFILVEGLLMRGDYFKDDAILDRLTELGSRLREGGYLLVGTKGSLKKPHQLFLDIYQREQGRIGPS